jgi:hypothetical protein
MRMETIEPKDMTHSQLVKARALAQLLCAYARDDAEMRVLDATYQRLRDEETARKVAKRLDQAIQKTHSESSK